MSTQTSSVPWFTFLLVVLHIEVDRVDRTLGQLEIVDVVVLRKTTFLLLLLVSFAVIFVVFIVFVLLVFLLSFVLILEHVKHV